MHKPAPSRVQNLLALAAAIGLTDIKGWSPSQILHKRRGKAPKGMRFTSSSVYTPAGPGRNVDHAVTRNPKIIANVNMMHEKWLAVRRVSPC